MNRKGNIQQNKLSLQMLQKQLDDIRNSSVNSSTNKLGKTTISRVQNFRQYIGSSLGVLWLISWAFYFINKIPLLRLIIPIFFEKKL